MSYEEEDTCHMRRRTHGIWVDGLLSKVPLHPGIVIRGALILRKLPALTKQVSKETYYRGKRDLCADFESLPALHFHLGRSLPCPCHHLANAPHGLRVGGHDADRAQVMQDIFSLDGGGADAKCQWSLLLLQ
jgi:hypothetical protein